MKLSTLVIITFFAWSGHAQHAPIWHTNYEKALEKANDEDKQLLISFAGSDWCKPCIMLTREVFETSAFRDYANDNLILLQADFPRLKKNRLEPDQQRHNEDLAEKFNPSGVFPLVVLLDASGQQILELGYQPGGPDKFISALSKTTAGD